MFASVCIIRLFTYSRDGFRCGCDACQCDAKREHVSAHKHSATLHSVSKFNQTKGAITLTSTRAQTRLELGAPIYLQRSCDSLEITYIGVAAACACVTVVFSGTAPACTYVSNPPLLPPSSLCRVLMNLCANGCWHAHIYVR